MPELERLMMLLPIVFMIHEYEEIIMFRRWLSSQRTQLREQFPRVEAFFTKRNVFAYSTATFALGTAHNFVLISGVTLISLYLEAYHWWFVALMAHTFHLLIHLFQWFAYRRYIPVIATTLLTLPYCIYAGWRFVVVSQLSIPSLALCSAIGFVLMLLSFLLTFYLMSRLHEL